MSERSDRWYGQIVKCSLCGVYGTEGFHECKPGRPAENLPKHYSLTEAVDANKKPNPEPTARECIVNYAAPGKPFFSDRVPMIEKSALERLQRELADYKHSYLQTADTVRQERARAAKLQAENKRLQQDVAEWSKNANEANRLYDGARHKIEQLQAALEASEGKLDHAINRNDTLNELIKEHEVALEAKEAECIEWHRKYNCSPDPEIFKAREGLVRKAEHERDQARAELAEMVAIVKQDNFGQRVSGLLTELTATKAELAELRLAKPNAGSTDTLTEKYILRRELTAAREREGCLVSALKQITPIKDGEKFDLQGLYEFRQAAAQIAREALEHLRSEEGVNG